MNKHSFSGKVRTICFFLLMTILPVSAQHYEMFKFFPGSMVKQWRWNFLQEWNSDLNVWDDTSSISYAAGGTIDQPAEVIIKLKAEDGGWKFLVRETFVYENGKVKTMSFYDYDSTSLSFSSAPYTQWGFTWDGDQVTSAVMEINLDDYISMYIDLDGLDLGLGDSKLYSEYKSIIENGKVTGGVTREKLSMSPIVFSHFKDSLVRYRLPADTDWVENGRCEVTYGNNYQVNSYSYYDFNMEEWSDSEKDSVILDGDKVLTEFSSIYDSAEEAWIYNTRISYSYNSEGVLTESLVSGWGGEWLYVYKGVFMYEAYPDAPVRYFTKANKNGLSEIIVSMTGNRPLLKLTSGTHMDASIQIFDMQGKSVGNTRRKRLSAGVNSVALNSFSQGNYLCKINTGKASAVVSFRVMR